MRHLDHVETSQPSEPLWFTALFVLKDFFLVRFAPVGRKSSSSGQPNAGGSEHEPVIRYNQSADDSDCGVAIRQMARASEAPVTYPDLVEPSTHDRVRLEVIGRLAGGIAHDLNNMLVAILGFSDILAQSMGGNDPRLADVRQLHLFYMPGDAEAGPGRNLSLVLQLSSTVGPIHADPGRVEQILMNLVLNSRDAMLNASVTPEHREQTL